MGVGSVVSKSRGEKKGDFLIFIFNQGTTIIFFSFLRLKNRIR